jgi:hypothetical protein
MSNAHRRSPSGLACLIFSASLAGGCASGPAGQAPAPQQAQLAQALAPPDRATTPESLPETARASLRPRMSSHAQDMGQLMSAIMALRYAEIEARAGNIAKEAHFGRPHDNEGALVSPLPQEFLDHQRRVRVLARALAGAAAQGQSFQIAHAYGQLSEACVRCHAVYRASP